MLIGYFPGSFATQLECTSKWFLPQLFAPAPNRGHGDGLGIFLSWGWVSNMITPSENTGSIILLVSKSREVIPMGSNGC